MCYHSGVVSIPTDTVGHAVGVLGVGILDILGRPVLVAVVAASL